MTKIALSGDWHVGRNGTSEAEHNQDLYEFSEWMIEECKKRGVSEFNFAGDWFEHRDKITLQSLFDSKRIFKLLNSYFGKFIALKGNHDLQKLDSRNINSLEPFTKWIDLVDFYRIENDIMYVSWLTSHEEFDEICRVSKEKNVKALVGHFEFNGFRMNDHYVIENEHAHTHVSLSHVPIILTGHFHASQQKVAQNGSRCLYLGSPFPFDGNDAGDHNRGFWILDTETLELEHVLYNKISIIDVTPEQLLTGQVPRTDKTSIRVVVSEELDTDTLEQVKQAMVDGGFRKTKIVHKTKSDSDKLLESESVDIGEILSIDQLVLAQLNQMDTSNMKSIDKDILIRLFTEAKNGA